MARRMLESALEHRVGDCAREQRPHPGAGVRPRLLEKRSRVFANQVLERGAKPLARG